MKRSLSEARRSAWQQPASCEFCRCKKIRCDKKRPCSNCTTRQLVCRYVSEDANTITGPEREDYCGGCLSLRRDVQELRSQVHKLERVGSCQPGSAQDIAQHRPEKQDHAVGLQDISHTWRNLEEFAATPQGESTAKPLVSLAPNCAIPTVANHTGASSLIAAHLPHARLAQLLFKHYVETADSLHREIHIPSTQALMETTYSQLSASLPVPTEILVLFCSIFASSSFYLCNKHSHQVPRELKDAHELQSVWKRIALESIMSHDAIASLTLTSLQSISIMMYLIWDSEGQSTTFHTLRSLAHTKAIQMKLHRLDAETAPDFVEAELKRRLWWHLAATDWIIGSVPGPQEGIYSFHTKHMCVRYPANLDDEDIRPDGLYTEGLPADQLTQMSYFLQRLKFAELCRDVMDSLPNGEASLPYDLVLRMSSRYTDFMDRLPWFFCPDEKRTAQVAVLASRRPYLLRQKSVLLYGIYSRIARLHRPFLLQGTDEKESFSVSHSLAIQCAERMIEIRSMVEPGDLCLHVHSHSMDQHSFSALLLLSIGILGEKDTELANKRKAKLLPICSTLKAKQGSLSRAGNGISVAIDRLVEILERPNPAHDSSGAHVGGTSIQDIATCWEEFIRELPSPLDVPWDDFLNWHGP